MVEAEVEAAVEVKVEGATERLSDQGAKSVEQGARCMGPRGRLCDAARERLRD